MTAAATKTIAVTETTDWPTLLEEAARVPVRLEHAGVVYRLTRDDDDIWAGYDPEGVREGLRLFAGMIAPKEAARMKELVYRGREEGPRPDDRP